MPVTASYATFMATPLPGAPMGRDHYDLSRLPPVTAAQAGERLRVLDEWAKRINSDIVVLRSHRSEARPEKALLKTLGEATTAIAAAFSAQAGHGGHAGQAAPVQIVIRDNFIRGLAENLETVLGARSGRRHQHKFVEVASSAVVPAPLVVYAGVVSPYYQSLEAFVKQDLNFQQMRARAGPNAKIALLDVTFGNVPLPGGSSIRASDGIVIDVVGLATPDRQNADFGNAANVTGLRALEKLLDGV